MVGQALTAYAAEQTDANWDAVVTAFVDGWVLIAVLELSLVAASRGCSLEASSTEASVV